MTVTIDKNQIRLAAEHAALSEHIYFRPQNKMPDGWKIVQTSDKLLTGKTGFFGALYCKTDPATKEKQYAIAIRGSDGNDLRANFAIAMGQIPWQFTKALHFIRQACAAEGITPQDVTLTGHSLGSYLARTAGIALGVKKVWAFAGPGPSQQTRDFLESIAPAALPAGRIVHVRSPHDIIGIFGTEEKAVLELPTTQQHHAIRNIRRQLEHMKDPAAPLIPLQKQNLLMRAFNVASKKLSSSQMLKKALQRLALYTRRDGREPVVTLAPRSVF